MHTLNPTASCLERIRDEMPAHCEEYWAKGYSIIRNVFAAEEIAAIHAALDRVKAQAMQHDRPWRHKNILFGMVYDKQLDRKSIGGAQWVAWLEPILDQVRTDPRMLAVMEPLIGNNLKQIINQVHWKEPGSKTAWHMHQDVRTRKPADAFRDLRHSYVQACLAVEAHTVENGCLRVVPYSNRLPDLHPTNNIMEIDDAAKTEAEKLGVDLSNFQPALLNPGDIGLWGPYTIHGSTANNDPNSERLTYINGYVKADNCDRGQWTFKNGTAVPLDEHALISYDHINGNSEPHYLSDELWVMAD